MIDLTKTDVINTSTLSSGRGILSFCEADSAILVRYTDGGEKLSWALNRVRPILIGRSQECDLTFPVRDISRKHAQIYWNGDAYVLEDLGSCNGTQINGNPTQQIQPLKNGDEIKFGQEITIYFVDDESTEPLPQTDDNRGLTIDHTNRTLLINGQPLLKSFSPPQYRMVNLLFDANEEIVSRQVIVEHVWADEAYDGVSEQAIDAMARRIRLQIAEIAPDGDYLQTVRGHGFRLIRQGS